MQTYNERGSSCEYRLFFFNWSENPRIHYPICSFYKMFMLWDGEVWLLFLDGQGTMQSTLTTHLACNHLYSLCCLIALSTNAIRISMKMGQCLGKSWWLRWSFNMLKDKIGIFFGGQVGQYNPEKSNSTIGEGWCVPFTNCECSWMEPTNSCSGLKKKKQKCNL